MNQVRSNCFTEKALSERLNEEAQRDFRPKDSVRILVVYVEANQDGFQYLPFAFWKAYWNDFGQTVLD